MLSGVFKRLQAMTSVIVSIIIFRNADSYICSIRWQFEFSEMMTIIIPQSDGNYNLQNADNYNFPKCWQLSSCF